MKLLAHCALTLLALSSPFDDCGNAWSRRVPPPPPPEPDKPFCMTDPPYGCVALCLGPTDANGNEPTWVTFTDNCKDISAGPQTVLFEAAVGMGGYMCGEDDSPFNPIYPASFGIATKQVEVSDACVAPPL